MRVRTWPLAPMGSVIGKTCWLFAPRKNASIMVLAHIVRQRLREAQFKQELKVTSPSTALAAGLAVLQPCEKHLRLSLTQWVGTAHLTCTFRVFTPRSPRMLEGFS